MLARNRSCSAHYSLDCSSMNFSLADGKARTDHCVTVKLTSAPLLSTSRLPTIVHQPRVYEIALSVSRVDATLQP